MFKRVLFLIDDLGNGGAERQLALLARSLPSQWQCQVWSMGDGPFAEVLRAKGIRVNVRSRSWRFDIAPALDLWRSAVGWRPDVVHSWGWMCTLSVAPACSLLGIPLVDSTVRGGMLRGRRGLVGRLATRVATRVVANSHAGLEAWGVGLAKGTVVYNGFDPERLAICAPAHLARADTFNVVMTGRMIRGKDYDTFLAALREVVRVSGQAWHFYAVGQGPQRPRLLDGARDLIQQGLASFPKMGMEVLALVRDAHVGVLLSDPAFEAEGCSNSIMEYMACGLPVVCTKSGGNQELVVDGETGFLIPPGDMRALAERLVYLRNHPDVAEGMGQAGRLRLRNRFSAARMVDDMIAVYEEVLAEPPRV